MRKYICLLIPAFLCTLYAFAQVQHTGWLASFNTFKVTKKFSMHFDAQVRSSDEFKSIQTILLRPGLNYHLSKKMTLTAGYAFIPNKRFLNNSFGLLTEHRTWQQMVYSYNWSRIATSHRLRFEQRFIPVPVTAASGLKSDGYSEAYRLRYFFRNVLPLTKQTVFKKGVFVDLQNEVFLNTGNKTAVNGKTFDQNRLYTAVGYRLPRKIDLEAGYLNQYIKGRTSQTNNHAVQLAVYKRL